MDYRKEIPARLYHLESIRSSAKLVLFRKKINAELFIFSHKLMRPDSNVKSSIRQVQFFLHVFLSKQISQRTVVKIIRGWKD